MAKIAKPKAILMDVEGTICDKKFFAKTLFPFVKSNVNSFLIETYDDSETKALLERLQTAAKKNPKMAKAPKLASGNRDMVCRSAAQCFNWLINRNMNTSEVKQMVLLCWLWGYSRGKIISQVYEDVPKALHEWKNSNGIKLYTFSSGLTAAQKLMLCQTNRGNICCLIDGFFDNSIGDKRSSKSYNTIGGMIGCDHKNILFISDHIKEAKAAHDSGLRVVLIKRTDNAPNTPDFPIIRAFTEIRFNA